MPWFDDVDVDAFHKRIQYAKERLGKSKFGFEITEYQNFKSKRHLGSGNELVDYSRTLCLGADPETRGLWERDCHRAFYGARSEHILLQRSPGY